MMAEMISGPPLYDYDYFMLVYCANMFQCGLWTVDDLFKEDGSLVPFDVWECRGVYRKHYILWRGLVNRVSKIERSFLSEKYRHLNRGFIESENTGILIDCVTEKEIKEGMRYTEYIRTINDSGYKSMIKYNIIHGYINISDWTDIFMLPRLCIVSNVVRDFQYKILHRFLPTQSLLFKMQKIDSPVCLYCNLTQGNLEHEVFDCLVIKNFWFEVMESWRNIGNHSIALDLRVLTLGYFGTDGSKHEQIAVNSLLLLRKFHVFLQK